MLSCSVKGEVQLVIVGQVNFVFNSEVMLE